MRYVPRLLRAALPVWLMAAAVVWGQAARTQDSPSAGDTSKYAGADTCQACHDDQYKSFAASAHEKLLVSKDPAQQGCEACHGPGAAHVNGNGDTSKVFRFQGAKLSDIRARCAACHQRAGADSSKHQKVSCLACHSVHHYQQKQSILAKPALELCRSCHP
jgi:hypothetical protein